MADPNPAQGMPIQFKKYYLTGAGSGIIRWGTDGDFLRCTKLVNEKVTENGHKPLPDRIVRGLCAKLHHEATGAWPGHAPGESKPRTAKN